MSLNQNNEDSDCESDGDSEGDSDCENNDKNCLVSIDQQQTNLDTSQQQKSSQVKVKNRWTKEEVIKLN